MNLVDKLKLLFSLCKHDNRQYFDINKLEYKIVYDKNFKKYHVYSPLDEEPICIINQKDEFGCFLNNLINHKGEL